MIEWCKQEGSIILLQPSFIKFKILEFPDRRLWYLRFNKKFLLDFKNAENC